MVTVTWSFGSHRSSEGSRRPEPQELPISVASERKYDSHDAANRPDVHLKAVPLLAQHLWGNVVGCPTQGLLALPVILHLGGQAKVTWRDGRWDMTKVPWPAGPWAGVPATYQSSPPCRR